MPPVAAPALAAARRRRPRLPPPGYEDLLRLTDGLDWNGVVIYASQETPIAGRPGRRIAGFVEANLGLRDDPRFADLLVLGSDGMDIFTYQVTQDDYQIYDEVPHEVVAAGLSFAELLTRILTRSLR